MTCLSLGPSFPLIISPVLPIPVPSNQPAVKHRRASFHLRSSPPLRISKSQLSTNDFTDELAYGKLITDPDESTSIQYYRPPGDTEGDTCVEELGIVFIVHPCREVIAWKYTIPVCQ